MQRAYGGTGHEYGQCIEQTSDDGYIMAGYTTGFGAGGVDGYFIKTDSKGNVSWSRVVGGTGTDYIMSVEQTSDGGYIGVGYTNSSGFGGYEVYLVKLSSTGTVSWTRTIGWTGNDYGRDVKQTSDNGYIIAGYTSSYGAGSYDMYILKTSSTGAITWSRTIGGVSSDYAMGVEINSDATYSVVGYTYSAGFGNTDVYFARLNTAGSVLITRTYGYSNYDYGRSIEQTSDGGWIIAGNTRSFGAGLYDLYAIKLNTSYSISWSRVYGGSSNDYGYSATQTSDLGYLISGYMASSGAGGYDMINIKTNSSGVATSSRTYGGTGSDYGYVGIQTSDGGFATLGSTASMGSGGNDFYLVKTDGTGNSGCSDASATYSSGTAATLILVGGSYNSGGIMLSGPSTNSAPSTSNYLNCTNCDLSVNAGTDNSVCLGSSVGIGGSPTASGGTTPHTYSWSLGSSLNSTTVSNPTSTPTQTSQYIVTVTDANGCEQTLTDTVLISLKRLVAKAGPDVSICRGSGTSLNVDASLLYDDFDPGIDSSQWSNLSGGSPGTSCGSVSGNALYFSGTSTRSITTNNLNTIGANTVSFYLKIGSGAPPCENAEPGEDVVLEYSTNSGTSWTTIATYIESAYPTFTSLNTTIPMTAKTSSTMFRWRQLSHSGGCCDHWSLDNIKILSSNFSYSWTPTTGLSSATVYNPTASPTATTSYIITVTGANGCTEKDTTIVTVSDMSSVTTKTDASCNGYSDGTASVDVSGGLPSYSYSWSNALSTSSISGLTAGTYGVTITDDIGCTNTNSAVITEPAATTSSISQTNVSCKAGSDGSIDLTVSGNSFSASCESTSTGCGTGSSTIVGTNTTYVSATGYPAPYGNYYKNGVMQMLFTASELNAAGIDTGTITSIALNIASLNSSTTTYKNFSIKMGCTNSANLGAGVVSGLTTVFTTKDITISTGWNTHTFDYNYNWNGGQNLVVEICFDNRSNPTYTQNASTRYTATSFTSVRWYRNDIYNACSWSYGSSTSNGTFRPNIRFNYCNANPQFAYSWSNGVADQDISGLSSGTYYVTISEFNGCSLYDTAIITQPASLTVSLSGTNIDCNGNSSGSITSSVSGGSTPYSYLWSTGSTASSITNLAIGTYYLTVTDDHLCTSVKSVTLTQPSVLSSSILSSDALCYGSSTGSINLTVSGGATPYMYNWSNGPTTQDQIGTVASNTYYVTVTDANSCVVFDTAVIDEPTLLSLSIVGTDISCNGNTDGSASISVSGGSTPYNYAWSHGESSGDISGLSSGTYIVTVTDDNSCTIIDSVTIAEPSSLASSIVGTDLSCHGASDGAANLTPSGGTTPYSYSWTSGYTTEDLSNITAGTFFVTITDTNGCTKIDSIIISQPPDLVLSTGNTDATCGNSDGTATVTPSGGFSPYTYLWSNGQTTSTATALGAQAYMVTVTDSTGCYDSAMVLINNIGAPSAGIAGTNVSCNGGVDGAANLTVTGGTTPYAFLWSNTATTEDLASLSAGLYSVTVTDSIGCIVIDSISVTEPATLSATLNVTDVTCNGNSNGSINLTVSGGTIAYSYSWSNAASTEDISGLVIGTYNVTITDGNLCVLVDSATVYEPTVLTSGIVGTDITCNGDNNGSANLTVSGGTAPYNYAWSNAETTEDIFSLAAGTFIVTVTDNKGCFVIDSVTIGEPGVLNASISGTNASCNGGSDGAADLTVSGGTMAYSFYWSNAASTEDISGLTAGTYTVTVIDNNSCSVSDSVVISESSALVLSGAVTNVTCNGSNDGAIDLTVSGGTPGYTFSWSNGATTEDISGINGGTYTVTLTDTNGCISTLEKTVYEPTVLSTSIVGTDITCNGAGNGSANLTALGGTTPYTYLWSNTATTEDISTLSSGTYYVTVTDSNSCTAYDTVIISEPVVLSLGVVGTDISCNGGNDGQANLTVTGGTLAYSYSWSNGASTEDISGLTIGTYYITVTDNNSCNANDSVTLTEPTILSSSATGTNISCSSGNDGAIDLTVSGGTPAYSYGWSNGATTEDLSNISAGTYYVTITDNQGCIVYDTGVLTQPSAMVLLTNTYDATCGNSDGSAIVIVSGGNDPYTYLWSDAQTVDSAIGLVAGSYTIIVTDSNSCIDSASVIINDIGAPALSTSTTNVSCNGGNDGATDLTVSGGTSPYTYLWSNAATTEDISGLTSGDYTVTVTDSIGCIAIDSAVINEPNILTSGALGTNISCNGNTDGSIDLTVSGGTLPYTYLWSNGATTADISSLGAGVFIVTITDNNSCMAIDSATITEPSSLALAIVGTDISCNGSADGEADLTVSGGTPSFAYLWSTGDDKEDVTDLNQGTYYVTVTDTNGCNAVDSVSIIEPGVLATSILGTTISCNGGNDGTADLTVTGGTSPFNYLWSTGATTQDITGRSAGTYVVTVSDNRGCIDKDTIVLTEPSALSAGIIPTDVNCNGGSDGSADLTVSGGVSPYTFIWSTGATTEDISALTAGTYIVTITDSNGCTILDTGIVGEPAGMIITTGTIDASCGNSDGQATVSVAGGTAPFTYLWGDGQTTDTAFNLSAGSYTINVTDFDLCQVADIVIINDAGAPSSSLSGTNISCNGGNDGSVNLTLVGGTAPFSYNWSNGDTIEDIVNLAATIYSVTVTDSNTCTTSDFIVLTEPSAISPSTSDTNVSCNNGSDGAIDLTVSGGISPYSYLWSNGATTQDISGLISGTYTFTVTDSNTCTITDSVIITEPLVLATSIIGTNISCNGNNDGAANLTVSGGASPYSYSWSNGATIEDVTGLSSGTYFVTITDNAGCSKNDTVVITEPGVINLSLLVSDVNCTGGNDGMINLTISGGIAPFSYLWSNSDTTEDVIGLTTGVYTVTVTDSNGCSKVALEVVDEPSGLLSIILSGTDVSCFGGNDGAINMAVAGGTPAYNYLWSNAATSEDLIGLIAAQYFVTVTDTNGCIAIDSILISEPSVLGLGIVGTDVSCIGVSDGSTDLTVTGGATPYTYLWSNGATIEDLSAIAEGIYQVTVTDTNGCSATDFTTISSMNDLSVLTSNNDATCIDWCDGDATATVSGGTSPFNYIWDDPLSQTTSVATSLCVGTFVVTVTDDDGCIASDTTIVSSPGELTLTISTTDATCGNADGRALVSVSGGTGPFNYLWSNGASTAVADSLTSGIYTVQVTDNNGCDNFGIAAISDSDGPTITIDQVKDVSCNGLSDGSIDITVKNGTGPYNYIWSNGSIMEDQANLIAGPYEVSITDALGCIVITSISISEPQVLALSLTTVDAVCGNSDGSATIGVTGGTTPYTYLWSTGGTSSTENALAAGTYHVTVTDSNSCQDSIVAAISNINGPVITIDSTIDIVCGVSTTGSIYISIAAGIPPYSYQWSNGSSTQDQTNIQGGVYDVTVTDSAGCMATESIEIFGLMPVAKPICLVTVDTVTGKNIVVWQKINAKGIFWYNIYKETSQSGVFYKIGSQYKDSLSTFIDSLSDPKQRSWRYKMAVADSCGNESDLSDEHKTIHLSMNLGLGGSVNLIWDHYEGFPVATYYINRYHPSTGWTKLDSVPSNLTSYSDFSPPKGNLSYQIIVDRSTGCVATRAKNYNSTRSNPVNKGDDSSGIRNPIDNINYVLVYPNPTIGKFNIEIDLARTTDFEINLFSMDGQLILSEKAENIKGVFECQFDMADFGGGIYFIQIISDKGIINRKIVFTK